MNVSRRLAAVLFDMDGVLVDSEPLWLDVERTIMHGLGARWSRADQQRCVGGPLRRTAEYMLTSAGLAAHSMTGVAALEQALIDGMADRLTAAAPLRPGAARLLAELAAADMPTALVTSSYRNLADLVLGHLGHDAVSVSVAGDEVRRRKPHPEPYLTAASLLDVDPRDCVVLEDSQPGLAAAAAAGCRCVGVPDTVSIGTAPGLVVIDSLTDIDLPWLYSLAQRLPGAG